jgi:hypothetical protein
LPKAKGKVEAAVSVSVPRPKSGGASRRPNPNQDEFATRLTGRIEAPLSGTLKQQITSTVEVREHISAAN